MRISEVIKKLQELQEKYGDLEVVYDDAGRLMDVDPGLIEMNGDEEYMVIM